MKESNAELVKAAPTITDAELMQHLENLGLVKNLTAGEKNTYIQIAKAFNLNPFKREIHVSKYGDQFSIITGYEVYIKRAERSGLLDGWEVLATGSVKDGNLKATITIYRKDRSKPFVWEVAYSEYVQKTKEGNPNRFWQKAETMTKKVAISQGFRLCFADELGGMPYTKEEIETEDVQHETILQPGNTPVDILDTPSVSDKPFGTALGYAERLNVPPEPLNHSDKEIEAMGFHKNAPTASLQPQHAPKPEISALALNKALKRLKAGEIELLDKLIETYDLTEQQRADIDAAWDEGCKAEGRLNLEGVK